MNRYKRVVVKLGTRQLCRGVDGNFFLYQSIFDDVADQIAEARAAGTEIAIVTSGFIQAGKEQMQSMGRAWNRVASMGDKELATIGTKPLFDMWSQAFSRYRMPAGLILVTHGNWEHPSEYDSIRSRVINLLSANCVPILNENDAVSAVEILLMQKGLSENDALAGKLALMIEADAVLFFTDVGGVYDDDPRRNPTARRYAEVAAHSSHDDLGIKALERTENGRGGMEVKVAIASDCYEHGIHPEIARLDPNAITRFFRGERVGTIVGKTTRFE